MVPKCQSLPVFLPWTVPWPFSRASHAHLPSCSWHTLALHPQVQLRMWIFFQVSTTGTEVTRSENKTRGSASIMVLDRVPAIPGFLGTVALSCSLAAFTERPWDREWAQLIPSSSPHLNAKRWSAFFVAQCFSAEVATIHKGGRKWGQGKTAYLPIKYPGIQMAFPFQGIRLPLENLWFAWERICLRLFGRNPWNTVVLRAIMWSLPVIICQGLDLR